MVLPIFIFTFAEHNQNLNDMKIDRKELLSKEYDITDIVLEYTTINDGKKNTFFMYMFDKRIGFFHHTDFQDYQSLFRFVLPMSLEDEEKVQLIREIAQFKDEWKKVMENNDLDEFKILTPDELVQEWEEYKNNEEEDYDIEPFFYTFNNGLAFNIEKGVNKYTLTIESNPPQITTFSSFEELLHGLAPVVRENIEDQLEFGKLNGDLIIHFYDDEDAGDIVDDISEIFTNNEF